MKFLKAIITKINLGLAIAALLPSSLLGAEALQATISIAADKPRTAVSPTLYGVFYEDINYAADGGLYAEMVQNRSFEYHTDDKRAKKASALPPLRAWTPVERKSMTCRVATATAQPLNERNPTYVTLTLAGKGEAGVANTGYHGGIPVKAGAIYDFSLYARRCLGQTANIPHRFPGRTQSPAGGHHQRGWLARLGHGFALPPRHLQETEEWPAQGSCRGHRRHPSHDRALPWWLHRAW